LQNHGAPILRGSLVSCTIPFRLHGGGDKQFEHYVVRKHPKTQKECENFFFQRRAFNNGLEMRIIARWFENIK
jgi:hypothetical protein